MSTKHRKARRLPKVRRLVMAMYRRDQRMQKERATKAQRAVVVRMNFRSLVRIIERHGIITPDKVGKRAAVAALRLIRRTRMHDRHLWAGYVAQIRTNFEADHFLTVMIGRADKLSGVLAANDSRTVSSRQ